MPELLKDSQAPEGLTFSTSTGRSGIASRWTTLRWDLLGLVWVILAGISPLLPALFRGIALGPYDILSTIGLTSTPGAAAHNGSQRDLITLLIPWSTLAWNQVHQGHLPLWNPLNGLGLPLAFNWQSGVLSLPSMIGYLVPLKLAYTTSVLLTVAVAGSGAYVFARVLRLGVLAATLVGTVFVLSGPMFSFLGYADASVGSWAGWMFAAAVLVIRGRRRLASLAALALTIALSVYAGHPETTLLLLLGLFLFVLVVLAQQLLQGEPRAQVFRSAGRVAIAGVTGAALSAPLLLPGLQLIYQSGRAGTGNYKSISIPDHALLQIHLSRI